MFFQMNSRSLGGLKGWEVSSSKFTEVGRILRFGWVGKFEEVGRISRL
jgi:hypothetical protein